LSRVGLAHIALAEIQYTVGAPANDRMPRFRVEGIGEGTLLGHINLENSKVFLQPAGSCTAELRDSRSCAMVLAFQVEVELTGALCLIGSDLLHPIENPCHRFGAAGDAPYVNPAVI
jgi:hypothetical protein